MVNRYIVNVHIEGHHSEEDPSCPWSWKGSGVFDYEVRDSEDIKIEVWAHSESDARRFAEEHMGNADYDWIIDSTSVESIEFVETLTDRDDEEVGVIDTL